MKTIHPLNPVQQTRNSRFSIWKIVYQCLVAALLFIGVFGPTQAASAIEITPLRSPQTITAWLVEDHSNPLISIDLAFRGGSALDPAAHLGLARFAAAALSQGAGPFDARAFQQKLSDLSISLSFAADRDSVFATLTTTTGNLEVAGNLLRLALTSPRFDGEALDRVREGMQSALRAAAEHPGQLAGRRMMQVLFPNHPYGQSSRGTAISLPAIGRDELQQFIVRRFALDNLVVSIVGDITPGASVKLLDRVFGALPGHAGAWQLPAAKTDFAEKPIWIEKTLAQNHIAFGQASVESDDPDLYAAAVLNYVLGGGVFESRLFKEIRVKRGLAYSIKTRLEVFRQSGVLHGTVGTANNNVSETIQIIRDQWRELATNAIGHGELADAKSNLVGSYVLNLSSASGIAGLLTRAQLMGLGPDFIERRARQIDALTPEALRLAAKRLLTPERLIFVVVGERAP